MDWIESRCASAISSTSDGSARRISNAPIRPLLVPISPAPTSRRDAQRSEGQSRHQWTQIVEAIAACYEHHDRYVERRKVLLVRQIAITRQEDLEVADRHGEQFALRLLAQPISGAVRAS